MQVWVATHVYKPSLIVSVIVDSHSFFVPAQVILEGKGRMPEGRSRELKA